MADRQARLRKALIGHPRARAIGHRVTSPARRMALPVLRGNGRGLRVRVGDSIMRVSGKGEPAAEGALLDLLRPGLVVYDVGANIGWYSLLAARAVGAEGRVIAFEPIVVNAALVEQNAQINGLDNVTVVPAALTDCDGWLSFQHRGSLEGRLERADSEAQALRRARRDGRVHRRTHVPAVTLDGWIAQTGMPAPDVVKIDVEGGELGVLRGMARTISAARPTLVIELHGTREEVADHLDSIGYQHSSIEEGGNTRQAAWSSHVLAHPAAI